MGGFTLGHYFVSVKDDQVPFYYYHLAEFWPEFYEIEQLPFVTQVNKMAKKTTPFRCTATAKIQSGYPHEVSKEHKQTLIKNGIKYDINAQKKNVKIPKLDLDRFNYLIKKDKAIAFSTPPSSNYVRDLTIYDEETSNDLVFCYVVSRRAQVLNVWSEVKPRQGFWKPRLPNGFHKLLCLQTKSLNN